MRLYDRHVKAQRRSVHREERTLTGLPDESAAELASCLAVAMDDPHLRNLEAEVQNRVMSSLSRLSDSDREILVLRYLEQMPGRDIAGVLGITETTARQRCLRALTRLTKIVEEFERED